MAAEPKTVDPGVEANRAGDWPRAAEIWGERALREPGDIRAHANYIRALMRMERITEAVVAVEFAREHHPVHEDFVYRQLSILNRGRLDAQLKQLLTDTTTRETALASPRCALLAGRALWRSGNGPMARQFLETAATDNEHCQKAAVLLGRLDYREGNLAEARRHWQTAREDIDGLARPEEPDLFLGRIAFKLGEMTLARSHFETARRINPAAGPEIDNWLPSAVTGPETPALPEDETEFETGSTDIPEMAVPSAEPEDAADIAAGLSETPSMEEPEPGDSDQPEPPDGSDDDNVRVLHEAREKLAAGDYNEALADAMDCLDRDEADADAAEIAGFAANRLQEWAAAAKAWGLLADLRPGRIGPLLQAASASEMLGEREQAIGFAGRVLELDPSNDPALVLTARQHARLGDSEGFRAFAERAAALPDEVLSDRFLTTVCDGFMSISDTRAAEDWIERGMARDEPGPDIRLRKARLLYADRRFEESAEAWEGLLDAPETVVRPFEPHVFLARCAMQLNDHADAAVHFAEAVRLNPDHIDSRDGLITALLRSGDLLGADRENEALRQRHPENPRGWLTHLLIAFRQGDETAISERYSSAMNALAEDAAALLQLGRTIESQRDLDLALQHWRNACERFPKDPELRFRLVAQMFNLEIDDHATLAETEKLLSETPDHEGGLFYLATLRHRLGQPEAAGAAFRRGMELYPANVGFWIGHATQLMTADKVADARNLLEQARTFSDDNDPVALADLARLAEVVDLPEEAERLFTGAIRRAPRETALWRRAVRFEMNRGAYGKAWDLALEARQLTRTDPIITSALVNAPALLDAAVPGWRSDGQAGYRTLLFPDDVFPAIAARSWPRPAGNANRRSAMLVTSTLGSGGSERQVMFSMRALTRVEHGYDDLHLVARSLNPHHRHDFFLPLIEETGFPVLNMASQDPVEFVRDLGEIALPHREAIRIAAAMPVEVQAMALPLLGIFLKHRPEAVHLWQDTVNIAGGLAALLAGVPRIVMGTRSTRPDARRRMRRYLEPGYQAMLALPQVSMVNNSHNGARDYEDWLRLPAGSVGVIHNGFDVESIRQAAMAETPGAIRGTFGIPADAPVIGGVMRFSEEKRPELFVEAAIHLAARQPDVHFLLVGDGPLRPELIRRVSEAGLSERIHLPGAKRPIEPWMREMSVLVLTSRMEGLPNVLIEAQILGVPVAATQVGGVPETMIPGETGIMVDSGDPSVLAEALHGMLSDPARLDMMGLAATEWAERSFSLEGMIGTTLEHYRLR